MVNRFAARPCDRVLVIGLDGATWDVLTPLAEQGLLPNLATLMRRAALAELRSTLPYVTPVAWSSFLTGRDPHEHGVWDYRYLDHRAGELRLNNAARLPGPTLYEAIQAAGGDVVSLNLPMTWPPKASEGSIVVGGIEAPSIAAALVPSPRFAARLRACGAELDLKTIWKRRPRSLEELRAGVTATVADFQHRAAAAEIADGMTDWRLMLVQYQTLDSLQHRCWDYIDVGRSSSFVVRADEAGASSYTAEVHRAMRALDDSVGRLLELAALRGAAVVALSDHGFGPLREDIHVPALLESAGFSRRAGWAARCRYRAARSLWKLRRWRAHRAACSSASVRRPLHGLAPIDWRNSRAFALHGELGAMVYLNTPQRNAAGPLRTTAHQESTTDELLHLFENACHPRTGEPLFETAFSTRRRFDCDPVERQWPDVIAIPAPGFQTRTKFAGSVELLSVDAELPATHRREGVLMVESPAVVAGRGYSADIRDVAPTILSLLGQPPASGMSGRMLAELLAAPDRRDLLPTETASWRESRAVASAGGDPFVLTAAENALVEQRLRDLGYLA